MYRSWLISGFLLLLPLLVYSNTIFAEFGLRDDYSILREAREEPGKVLHGCASQARPLYGVLLEHSFRQLNGIRQLAFGRFAAALLLGATLAATAYLLRNRLGWPTELATATAALVGMLPSAQVIVSWSICWPFTLATLLAAAAFGVAQKGWAEWPRRRAPLWLASAVLMLAAAALIYPPQALLFLIFVAAATPLHRSATFSRRLTFMTRDVALLGVALAAAFLIAESFFFAGAFAVSPRIAFEQEWLSKLHWIVSEPLKDGLALFALDDYYGRTNTVHWMTVIGVLTTIAAGGVIEFQRHGWRAGAFWLLALPTLVVASLSVTLIAAERWAPYRTLFGLAGVLLIFVILGLTSATTHWLPRWPRLLPTLLGIAGIFTMTAARNHAWNLIAVPQMEELRLIREGSAQIDPKLAQHVFVLRPAEDDAPSEIIFDDEFGSLSTNSDWTPVEMIKQVVRQRSPDVSEKSFRTTILTGWLLPKGEKWDIVIDLKHVIGHAGRVAATTARNVSTAAGVLPPKPALH